MQAYDNQIAPRSREIDYYASGAAHRSSKGVVDCSDQRGSEPSFGSERTLTSNSDKAFGERVEELLQTWEDKWSVRPRSSKSVEGGVASSPTSRSTTLTMVSSALDTDSASRSWQDTVEAILHYEEVSARERERAERAARQQEPQVASQKAFGERIDDVLNQWQGRVQEVLFRRRASTSSAAGP
mmetsp:Transcript_5419/g.9436  ORF Transcript_5419/g.9436 Transcript_5419/m.9436 type:complete len:184 (+) Transcript_5419:3-554(+)